MDRRPYALVKVPVQIADIRLEHFPHYKTSGEEYTMINMGRRPASPQTPCWVDTCIAGERRDIEMSLKTMSASFSAFRAPDKC